MRNQSSKSFKVKLCSRTEVSPITRCCGSPIVSRDRVLSRHLDDAGVEELAFRSTGSAATVNSAFGAIGGLAMMRSRQFGAIAIMLRPILALPCDGDGSFDSEKPAFDRHRLHSRVLLIGGISGLHSIAGIFIEYVSRQWSRMGDVVRR